jgi:hypothetical protein
MSLIDSLLIAAALQPAPTPPLVHPGFSMPSVIECVRLKARPLAATARTETSIAYESVRACEARLDALPTPGNDASQRERDTSRSLRTALLDRMIEEAKATVRQQRGR